MKIGQSAYFKKLVLLTILLGALPTLVLGGYSYYQAYRSVRQNAEEGNRQFLMQSQLRVEQNLKNIDTTLTSFLHSPFVQTVLQMPLDPKYYDSFGQLEKTMYRLQIFELQVDNLELISRQQRWLLSNGGIVPLTETKPGYDWLHPIAESDRNTLWLLRKGGGLTVLKKDPLFTDQPNSLLAAYISEEAIRRTLATEQDTGGVFIASGTGEPVYLPKGNRILTDDQFASIIAKWKESAAKAGSFPIRFSGGEFSVTYRMSSYNGWIYFSVIPISNITANLSSIAKATAALCLGILLVLAVLAVLSSRKFYRPIRSVYLALSGMDAGEDAGVETSRLENERDELRYIRSGVLRILNERKHLGSQNQLQVEHLKEFFVQKLIKGAVSDREINEKSSPYRLPDTWRTFAVMVIQIDNLNGTRYMEQDRDLLLFAISNIVGEITPAGHRLNPIVEERGQVTVFGSDTEDLAEFKKEIYRLAVAIRAAVADYLGLSVTIGVSRPYRELKRSDEAYKQALEAASYRIRLGENAILFLEEVEPEHADVWAYPIRLEQEIIEAVRVFDDELAGKLLRQFVLQVLTENVSPRDYQLAFVRLLAELLRQLQEAGISHYALHAKDAPLLERLFQLHTPEEISLWFENEIVVPMMSLMKDKRQSHQLSIAEKLYRMITEELDADLTLEGCADRIGYHPDYAGRVFRCCYGASFSDYLLQARMNKAKEWLAETDWKVAEIAEKLHYSSPANFIRSFRKLENMTPGQYRELSRERAREAAFIESD